MCAEDSRDIFPEAEQGGVSSIASKIVNCIGEPYVFKGEVSAVAGERLAQARYGEVLTGRSADEEVSVNDPCFIAQAGEIAMQRHIRVVMGEDRARKCFDLRERQRRPTELVKGHTGSLYPGADREVLHFGNLAFPSRTSLTLAGVIWNLFASDFGDHPALNSFQNSRSGSGLSGGTPIERKWWDGAMVFPIRSQIVISSSS